MRKIGEPLKRQHPTCMHTQLENLTEECVRRVVDLELMNMAPLLAKVGFHITADIMWAELLRQPHQHILMVIDESGIIQGLLRANPQGSGMFISSIQLRKGTGAVTLRQLIKKARDLLHVLSDIETLTSVAQKSNPSSIRRHKRLGFEIIKDHEKAVRFSISRQPLIDALARMR